MISIPIDTRSRIAILSILESSSETLLSHAAMALFVCFRKVGQVAQHIFHSLFVALLKLLQRRASPDSPFCCRQLFDLLDNVVLVLEYACTWNLLLLSDGLVVVLNEIVQNPTATVTIMVDDEIDTFLSVGETENDPLEQASVSKLSL